MKLTANGRGIHKNIIETYRGGGDRKNITETYKGGRDHKNTTETYGGEIIRIQQSLKGRGS